MEVKGKQTTVRLRLDVYGCNVCPYVDSPGRVSLLWKVVGWEGW